MAKNRNEHELREQITFMQWVVLNRQHAPNKEVRDALELCYGTLNGVKLTPAQAGKAKASCAAKGIPDINLDWPAKTPGCCLKQPNDEYVNIFHGLRIEMKHGKNKLSEAQKSKKKLLEKAGYKYEVCYSAKAAIQAVVDYLPFSHKDYAGLKEFTE
jgi:hypothetical protein